LERKSRKKQKNLTAVFLYSRASNDISCKILWKKQRFIKIEFFQKFNIKKICLFFQLFLIIMGDRCNDKSKNGKIKWETYKYETVVKQNMKQQEN
jgi:hypothetical protein